MYVVKLSCINLVRNEGVCEKIEPAIVLENA